jgi:predicted RecB family nuclease
MLLTAQLLLHYQRCPRRAFLDVYGDPSQQETPSDFLLKLIQDSQVHQQSVLVAQTWIRPRYPEGDWRAAAQATLHLMQQGVEQIHQGVLTAEDSTGLTLISSPTLLTRQPGYSQFGDWLYVPTDIKLSKRPKLEYQIVMAFHVQVLAMVQGAWPEVAWLYLRHKGFYKVDLWQVLPQMQESLAALGQMLLHQQEPEVFIARNRCSLCSWFGHCHGVAEAQRHLSLLPGVTPTRYLALQQLELTTVKALAIAEPAQLEPLPGFGFEVAAKLVSQAQAILNNQPLPLRFGTLIGTTVPTATVELYFDIEAEPELNLAYLHGVLVVDRRAKTQTFHGFLAEGPEDEGRAWEQFLALVQAYPTAPIFHFCAYEAQTVERLGKRYHTPKSQVRPILKRFVDLHQWVVETVTLPVESYTLKLIARWVGFQWRDANANGAQAIYWYNEWLRTGDRTYLEAILRYNEDDCRATYLVKDWLAEFTQSQAGVLTGQ